LFAFAVAAAVGLGTTWLALTRGTAFGAVAIGAWTAWPKTGTRDIDPYARAAIARSGELPIGSGDGVAFFARTDDHGKSRSTAAATSTSAAHAAGAVLDAHALRSARPPDRQFGRAPRLHQPGDHAQRRRQLRHRVAPRARYGNWLPTGGVDSYMLVLRLYDSPVGVATRAAREAPMPAVSHARQSSCA
jgi:hypothetical protein